MNLPNFLAPAPPPDENAHGFDFPFRANSPDWSRTEFTASCRCGEVLRIPAREVHLAIQTFSPFLAAMEVHADLEYEKKKDASKWGTADRPLDNSATVA
jgi:hypothetical protein